MIVRMKNTFRMLLAAMLLSLFALPGYSWQKSFPEKDYVAYLFTYFTGNSGDEEAVRYAVSMDGYTYWALNDNEPVIDSKVISSTGGVRDPHILRCEDGKTFYMVVTDMVSANGWSSNRAMVLLKSTDLVNWSHSVINIQKRYSGQEDLKRVWAPQTIYDPEVGKYMTGMQGTHRWHQTYLLSLGSQSRKSGLQVLDSMYYFHFNWLYNNLVVRKSGAK